MSNVNDKITKEKQRRLMMHLMEEADADEVLLKV